MIENTPTGRVLRPALRSDAEAIWSILEPIFRAGTTYCVSKAISRSDALDFWAGGLHQAYVLEENGVVLGTYYLCPNQRGGGAHVANAGFATALAAKGRGVARAMLTHALEEARERKFRAMQFNFVVETNARAINLWKQADFEVVGRLPGAFLHPSKGYVDALVMYRKL